ncbi:hypothetical protein BaRGS_00011646 [Batillaria attramentaria]|uniref:PRA1 family protein n=1 Tax=Batillaria attramentaria TaxID=370345 RepID=A0ABD0LD92_9CAEN
MEEKQNLEGKIDYTPAETPSFKSRFMSLSMSNVSAREFFHRTRERVRPWSDFLNTKRFKMPGSLGPVPKRIVKNVDNFQGNYVFVFLGLFIFCVLTSPMLIVAIAACLGACYIINIKNHDKPLMLMGREVSVAQQYAAVGASFFVIMLHASTYTPQEELEGFDIEMDSVETV